jgi:uncharacterized spore protein YtfJ
VLIPSLLEINASIDNYQRRSSMKDEVKEVLAASKNSWTQTSETIDKLFDVARPSAIFSDPVTIGERTIITASEVGVGMGVGYGSGGGTSGGTEGKEESEQADKPALPAGEGFGGGGGGGGYSSGRPVAAIVIEPDGVRVEPVFDVTKIALAFFTMLGSVFFMGMRIRQAANKLK